MRFKLDENMPLELSADLRVAGHDVETVQGEGLTGAPDSALTERVQREQRALLTMDKGIADVRMYPPQQYAGLVLLRPGSSGRGAVLAFVRRHLAEILATELTGRLLVVTERGVRIR